MTDPIRVKPADGRRVRKPDGALLADGGERVTLDAYWRRRIACGDAEPLAEKLPPAVAAKTGDDA